MHSIGERGETAQIRAGKHLKLLDKTASVRPKYAARSARDAEPDVEGRGRKRW